VNRDYYILVHSAIEFFYQEKINIREKES
jgi:hypothetical protein